VYIRLTRTYGNIWARTNGSSSRGTKGSSNAEEEESQLFPSPGLLLSDTTTNTTTTTRTSSKCDTPTTKSYHIELNPMSPTPQKKPSPTAATITTIDTNDSTRIHTSRNRELRRFLLLNGYPILYLLLWIPGMANRAAELAHGKSPTYDAVGWVGECFDVCSYGEVCREVEEAFRAEEWVCENDVMSLFFF
jgi:hypothetical protein